MVSFVDEFREKTIREQTQQDIGKAVELVKEEIGVDASDRLIEGLLHRQASTDQRFMKAFQNRDKDPSGWQKILKASAQEFKSDFDRPDPDTTEDTGAVRAAVRSATNSPPIAETVDPSKLNGMSDAEFAAFKQQLGG